MHDSYEITKKLKLCRLEKCKRKKKEEDENAPSEFIYEIKYFALKKFLLLLLLSHIFTW
jgi:hypothetical protein